MSELRKKLADKIHLLAESSADIAALKASTEQWNETMRQKKEWADEKDAEPVAWMLNWNVWFDPLEKRPDGTTPLYTTPPTATANSRGY